MDAYVGGSDIEGEGEEDRDDDVVVFVMGL